MEPSSQRHPEDLLEGRKAMNEDSISADAEARAGDC